MFDNYTRLSGELRQLAFRKSSEQATWQGALKQQQREDSEHRLDKLPQASPLAIFSAALRNQFNPWRRTHPQASATMNNLPSRH
jgi:hypothetical protein